MKKPQKMYKNLRILTKLKLRVWQKNAKTAKNVQKIVNLDKTQIEGLTEKCKNCKNVQKSEKMEIFSKSWKFVDKTQIEKMQKIVKKCFVTVIGCKELVKLDNKLVVSSVGKVIEWI